MRALGIIVEHTKPKRCDKVPAGGVCLGCNSKVFLVAEGVGEPLHNFVHVLQDANLPAPKVVTDSVSHDCSFDQVLVNIDGMGPRSDYLRPHVRRKRMLMLCKRLGGRDLWAQTSIDHLKSMVPDSSDALSEFRADEYASHVSDIFGLDVDFGPLMISCWACLWKPVH